MKHIAILCVCATVAGCGSGDSFDGSGAGGSSSAGYGGASGASGQGGTHAGNAGSGIAVGGATNTGGAGGVMTIAGAGGAGTAGSMTITGPGGQSAGGTGGTGAAGHAGSSTAGAGGTGGSPPTCGGSTCNPHSTCVADQSGNEFCAAWCSHSSDCSAAAGCCAPLSNGTFACVPDDLSGACTCFTGSECTSGACTPAVDMNDNPTPGYYVCSANDGAPYHGCNGFTSCGGSTCCMGDSSGNLFCANPCTNASTCGGASCNVYDGSHTTCSTTSACGP